MSTRESTRRLYAPTPTVLVPWREGCRRLGVSPRTAERRIRDQDGELPQPLLAGGARYFLEPDIARIEAAKRAMDVIADALAQNNKTTRESAPIAAIILTSSSSGHRSE